MENDRNFHLKFCDFLSFCTGKEKVFLILSHFKLWNGFLEFYFVLLFFWHENSFTRDKLDEKFIIKFLLSFTLFFFAAGGQYWSRYWKFYFFRWNIYAMQFYHVQIPLIKCIIRSASRCIFRHHVYMLPFPVFPKTSISLPVVITDNILTFRANSKLHFMINDSNKIFHVKNYNNKYCRKLHL